MPPRQAKRPTAPEIRDRNTRDLLGRPGLAGLARIGGVNARGRGGGQSVLTNVLPDDEVGAAGAGQLLVLSATGVSIASGGDHVAFDSLLHRRGFEDAGIVAGGDAVVWPITAVGSIQVEFAWDSYQGGGTVEIEVDGTVPAWGMVGSSTSGQEGCKRRSVDIQGGSVVKIKVTQTSGVAQTADVLVEFEIQDPAETVSRDAVKITDAIASRAVVSTGETFFDDTFDFYWDGNGRIVVANTEDGTGSFFIDDKIRLDVTHGDGSTASYELEIGVTTPAGPLDVSAYLEAGTNSVRVRLMDVHGALVSSDELWLVKV